MIAVKTNCSDTNTPSVVVTFHQMIGDILLSLHKYRKKRKQSVTEVLDELAVPIVILAFCDQNWGFLSTSNIFHPLTLIIMTYWYI